MAVYPGSRRENRGWRMLMAAEVRAGPNSADTENNITQASQEPDRHCIIFLCRSIWAYDSLGLQHGCMSSGSTCLFTLLTGKKTIPNSTLMKVERKCLNRGQFLEIYSQLSSVSVTPGCSSAELCTHSPKRSTASCHSQSMWPKNPVRKKHAIGPAATPFEIYFSEHNFVSGTWPFNPATVWRRLQEIKAMTASLIWLLCAICNFFFAISKVKAVLRK